jgi:hypothetical protein
MNRKWLLFALVVVALAVAGVWFLYPRPRPLYCLLVFGPEGKTRVWVVWRGNTAYLHRDGDLNRPGERMACASSGWALENVAAKWARFSTDVASLEDGTNYNILFHKGGANAGPDGERSFTVYATVGDPAGSGQGYCMIYSCAAQERLAEDPAQAPVVPFGTLEVVPLARQQLVLGEENDLQTTIGTVRRLDGTFDARPSNYAVVSHAKGGVSGQPVAMIEFPPAVPGAAPVRARYPLPGRC